jgi:hypothetical protein
MNGYFLLVDASETYRDKIWPMGHFHPNEIIFVDDIKPFKVFAYWYKSVYKTLRKYPESERDFYLKLFGLIDEERVNTQKWRKWNQLSFGVCWRATFAVGLLEGKRVLSLPNFDDAINYWKMPIVQDIWQYLLTQGYIILVSAEKSSWLRESQYQVVISEEKQI